MKWVVAEEEVGKAGKRLREVNLICKDGGNKL